jgi:hypothetical protein
MWHAIASSSGAEALMQVWGGYFVTPDLTMKCADTPDLKCRVIVQRQCNNPVAVELLFDGVSHISIVAPAGYDRIIMRATLRVEDGKVTWSPDADFDQSNYNFKKSSVIVAYKLWWRAVEVGYGPGSTPAELREVPDGFVL